MTARVTVRPLPSLAHRTKMTTPPGYFAPGYFPPGYFAGGEATTTAMSVHEFLTDLYNDELSDLFIGNRNHKEEPRSKLIPIINRGMLMAYAKYRIIVATEELEVIESQRTYIMSADNVLAVTDVVNGYGRSLTGDEVRISSNVLTFPNPVNTTLQIEYKVQPATYDLGQDDENVGLVLPTLLVPWLSSWVAHRIYRARKDEASVFKAADLLQAAIDYELIYQQTNTTNEFSPGNSDKLTQKGFA
jgi:hypothetical protein